MKVDTSVALKAGVIGAVAGLVAALIVRIPVLGCLVSWLGFIVALATGALYVYFASGKVEIAEGAAGGALAGAIAGAVNSLISGILGLIFDEQGFFSLIISIVIGAVGGAVLGAVGGLVYAAIKK